MSPLRGHSEVDQLESQGDQLDHWQRFKSGDFKQKWDSAKLIIREGDSAIAPLLALLHDSTVDAETHWFTIRALGGFPQPEVVAALATQIGATVQVNRTAEQTEELSAFAIETLAAMGPLAIDVLSQQLQHPEQRQRAAKALNQVRVSGIIPAMVSIANDDNALVRYYAVDALGSFHGEAVTPVLLGALTDTSGDVRKAAVMALGRRQDLQASQPLSQRIQPLLWDVDVSVSCQAALALGRLQAENALEALQRVLLSTPTPMALRIDVVRALEWYCDRNVPSAPNPKEQSIHRAFTVLTEALKTFLSGPDTVISPQDRPNILVAIIRVLGELHSAPMATQASVILTEQLQAQPTTLVLQAIIMALAKLRQPQAFDALLPLLTHSTDSVPIHAIAALKQLDPDQGLSRVSDYLRQVQRSDVLDLW